MNGTESYVANQLNYVKHVNMQEAQINNYYTKRELSITRSLEVFTVIHDKMDHAKITSSCCAHRIKAMDKLLKLSVLITCTMVLSNLS